MHIYFVLTLYLSLAILMFTIGVLPDWDFNTYVMTCTNVFFWSVEHMQATVWCIIYLFVFYLLVRFRKRIVSAAGIDYVTFFRLGWRDLFPLFRKLHPVEIYIWKVEGINSAAKPLANNLYIEGHMGTNEPVRTRVHNGAGNFCMIRESFQINIDGARKQELILVVKDQSLLGGSELGRLRLKASDVNRIEEKTGKSHDTFAYAAEAFEQEHLTPRGSIWIAISPIDTNDAREDHEPLLNGVTGIEEG
jgi:hypothetical protein